ncbi:MAG: putative Ig domain-containing protein, partial [Betaproteobacteria bacterium]
ASVNQTFAVAVANTNDAPIVATPLTAQVATAGTALTYVVPVNTFTDVDIGDSLTLTASLANGSALPSWLTFNAATRTFSGTPANGDAGNLSLKVIATDLAGAAVSSSFAVTVNASNPGLTLTGTSGNDALTGGSGNDTLSGGAGADTLTGGAGNDLLDGGTGADRMVGGTGNDNYVVDSSSDVIVENANEGTDAVQSSITYTLGANVENLTLTGASAINGTGNSLNNVLTGNAANNTLNGGTGADTMMGGAGNDAYGVDNIGDVVTENANEGTDSVTATISYTLGANVENLTLSGATAINGTGNALVNKIVGNDAVNTISVGDGNDTVWGQGGNDVIYGGNGNDLLGGDAGDDTVWGEAGDDYLQGDVGNDALHGGDGNDTLTGYDGNDSLYGDAGNDNLWAGIGNDTLWGGDGADQMGGDAGDDVLYGEADNDSLYGADGSDLVDGGSGNDYIEGEAGNDVMQGGDGDDSLYDSLGNNAFLGGAGADYLNGAAGNNLMAGGTGNDTLVTGSGNDIVLFNKGDGQDIFSDGGTGNDTLSLGGNFAYNDLSFTKSSNDLVLKVGATDQITFQNWYAATPSKPVVNLQVIAEAMAGFSAGGSNPLLDQKVEAFNFAGLAGAFDAARAANPTLTSWALTNALTNFQLAGSDTAAIGGDLAYQYGKNGNLSGIGMTATQGLMSDSKFGNQAQTLQPLSTLQNGTVQLS